ncbi:hypothetical protein BKA80DRAFT_89430 [Phyllosticta citrichinensis]
MQRQRFGSRKQLPRPRRPTSRIEPGEEHRWKGLCLWCCPSDVQQCFLSDYCLPRCRAVFCSAAKGNVNGRSRRRHLRQEERWLAVLQKMVPEASRRDCSLLTGHGYCTKSTAWSSSWLQTDKRTERRKEPQKVGGRPSGPGPNDWVRATSDPG